MKHFSIDVHSDHSDGKPSYRFYKLIYTAALRLKLVLPLSGTLSIQLEGKETLQAKYKSRTTYLGRISINGMNFEDVIYVVDALHNRDELVTFWRKIQPGDAAGSKGGAHQFAEAYLGFLAGKMLEDQAYSPQVVADELADIYNSDPKFNITVWIIQKAHSLSKEPAPSGEPLENPNGSPIPEEFFPELILLNKWKTDVLRTGISYTNYEVDACIKDLAWGRDDRIQCLLHWENGNYIQIEDFGKYDRFSDKASRALVFNYLLKYTNTSSRSRLILTVKGDSTQWTLASSTMLIRLRNVIA